MRRNVVLAVLAAGILLAGCGGSGGGKSDPTATTVSDPVLVVTATTLVPTPTTAPPTSTPAPLPTATSAPATPTRDPVVLNSLAAIALAQEDVPAGYVPTPIEPSEPERGPCGHPHFERADNKLGEVEVQFQASDLGPFIIQSLVEFPQADAADAFAYARASFDCSEWTSTEADSAPTTYRVAPLEAAPASDESFAVRVELDIEGVGTLTTDTVYLRVGMLISMVGYATVDAPDPKLLDDLVQTAAAKMAAADLP